MVGCNSSRRNGTVVEMGVDEMGVDEMASRQSGNKPIKPAIRSCETRYDSNRPAELQRLSTVFKF